MDLMKKTYQTPMTNEVMLTIRQTLLSGSVGTNLDGFGGNGGGKSGGSADSRGTRYWDDEEE